MKKIKKKLIRRNPAQACAGLSAFLAKYSPERIIEAADGFGLDSLDICRILDLVQGGSGYSALAPRKAIAILESMFYIQLKLSNIENKLQRPNEPARVWARHNMKSSTSGTGVFDGQRRRPVNKSAALGIKF